MTWLTLRQFRAQAISALVMLGAIGAVLAYTGPHLVHIYQASGITTCPSNGDCGSLVDAFTQHYGRLQHISELIIVLPALIGLFWGAPLLARELETGTYRLAWTQGVTRTRWLANKVLVVGAAAIVTTGLLTLIVAWWARPLDTVNANRLDPGQFSQRGIVPLAYAFFAFALGLAAGAVLRRVIPAMAVVLGGFFALRLAIQELVRGHLFMKPVSVTAEPFASAPAGANAWSVSSHFVDRSGSRIGSPKNYLFAHCGLTPERYTKQSLTTCTQRWGLHEIISVQPGNRFWPLQLDETAVFVVLGLACIAFTYWWTQRRIV